MTEGRTQGSGTDWRFKWAGSPLPWLARIRVWWWLKRCERIVKRHIKKGSNG